MLCRLWSAWFQHLGVGDCCWYESKSLPNSLFLVIYAVSFKIYCMRFEPKTVLLNLSSIRGAATGNNLLCFVFFLLMPLPVFLFFDFSEHFNEILGKGTMGSASQPHANPVSMIFYVSVLCMHCPSSLERHILTYLPSRLSLANFLSFVKFS